MRKAVKIGIYGILVFVDLLYTGWFLYLLIGICDTIKVIIQTTNAGYIYNFHPSYIPILLLQFFLCGFGIFLTTFFIVIFTLLNKHKTLLEASKYVYFNFEVLKQERIEKRLQKENAKKEKKNNKIQRKIEKLNNMKDD